VPDRDGLPIGPISVRRGSSPDRLTVPRIRRRKKRNTTVADIIRTPPIADPTPAPILAALDEPWPTALGIDVGDIDGDDSDDGDDGEGVPDTVVGEAVGQNMRVMLTPAL
jgi:hypothetical protein